MSSAKKSIMKIQLINEMARDLVTIIKKTKSKDRITKMKTRTWRPQEVLTSQVSRKE